MVKRIYNALPGPPAVRLLIVAVAVAAALVVLALAFERAGDLIDNGGVIQ